MPLPRPFALVQTGDQWLRCGHVRTSLEEGIVELATIDDTAQSNGQAAPKIAAGLAFDRHCRLFHSLPEDGSVERLLWAALDPLQPATETPPAAPLFGPAETPDFGEFAGMSPETPLQFPLALGFDSEDRLYIAEAGLSRVLIYDLRMSRLERALTLPARPIDLAISGTTCWALTDPAGLVRFEGRGEPDAADLPAGAVKPARLCFGPGGEILVLDRAATSAARILSSRPPLPVPFATDIEFLDDILIVARLAGMDFRRFRITGQTVAETSPLKAKGYDGRGIVITPDRQVGFFGAFGFRNAVAARQRYQRTGQVATFRLDSGAFRTQWGRLFLDACIPPETEIHIRAIAADEPPDTTPVPRSLPANVVSAQIHRPDLSPPMPPAALVPGALRQSLHRRESGREIPFLQKPAADRFATYEAPVIAGPGRYLWVVVELEGNSRSTPRFRSLRAEYPAHDLLRRLPKIYSRESAASAFLSRYLAMFDGMLGEFDVRATLRHVLLNPDAAPDGALVWLAGFLGLTLDERWPDGVRRTLIREAAWLFRFRGTVRGMTRFLEIVTGAPVVLIEKFRLRGITGASEDGQLSSSILGAGFRVGAPVGAAQSQPPEAAAADAFAAFAHRFSVMIQATLGSEELAMVRDLLETHRPAHTVVDLCVATAGMRVGSALHVGMTSIIGPTDGFETLQIGGSALGRRGIIGRPKAGTIPEASRAGWDSRVG